MTQQFTVDHKLSEVKTRDIVQGFAFQSGIGNVIKWYMIGLMIQNDKLVLEEFNTMFTKNGSLYDKRAYKTEASAVFKAISEGRFSLAHLTIDEIKNKTVEELDESVGMLYKSLDKKSEPKPKIDQRKRAIAKQAINDPAIDTGTQGVVDLLNGLNGKFGAKGKELAQEIMQEGEQSLRLSEYRSDFPELTTDNLDKIVTVTKEYLTEMYATFPAEFSDIALHVMELDTKPVINKQAA